MRHQQVGALNPARHARRIFAGVALQLFMVLLVTLVAFALPIQTAQTRYAGRPVADGLQELQRPELRIISRPAGMQVQAEPKSTDPKEIAREILEPHGPHRPIRTARHAARRGSTP
jgi:hypothetical protein